jgi:hypothetical protein
MEKTDTEVRNDGMKILIDNLGKVDTLRFVSIIQNERYVSPI